LLLLLLSPPRAAKVNYYCFEGSSSADGLPCLDGATSAGGTAKCSVTAAERGAVADLFAATGGASWTGMTAGPWDVANRAADVCAFLGVTCISSPKTAITWVHARVVESRACCCGVLPCRSSQRLVRRRPGPCA
jgi:hypothetical protein